MRRGSASFPTPPKGTPTGLGAERVQVIPPLGLFMATPICGVATQPLDTLSIVDYAGYTSKESRGRGAQPKHQD